MISILEAAKDALTIRYSLLPFLYSLFVKSHLFGHPVVTPTFFHANPGDKLAYGVDWQMFWGSGLLIVPVLQENDLTVEAYLPSGIWYDFRTMQRIHAQVPGFVSLEAPLTTIPLLGMVSNKMPISLLKHFSAILDIGSYFELNF